MKTPLQRPVGRFRPCCSPALLPPAYAEDAPPKLDSGDTAWMLTSTALVLLMTVPGPALFYAGMVRKKNILATMMQSFIITCLVTVVWMIAGYSLAFTNGNAYFGDSRRFLLNGIADKWDQAFMLGAGHRCDAQPQTIPETVYMMFQMTFAIITPALIAGAFADRHEVLLAVRLHGAVVAVRLLADRALGLGPDRLAGRRARRRPTSPAARWCTSTPVSPGWCARWCSANGSATARQHGAVQPRLP